MKRSVSFDQRILCTGFYSLERVPVLVFLGEKGMQIIVLVSIRDRLNERWLEMDVAKHCVYYVMPQS